MKGAKAKMLRRAAQVRGAAPQYNKLEMGKIVEVPVYETYTRAVREMGTKGKVTSREVRKIRYRTDGKMPARMLMDKTGLPLVDFWPRSKPVTLVDGSPRAVYQGLKAIAKRLGLVREWGRYRAIVTEGVI